MRPSAPSLVNLLGLYLIFSECQRGCCEETVWQPPKPIISPLQAISDKQSLVVSWQMNHSGLVDHFYEIQIGRTANRTIVYNRNVSVTPVDSHEHTWTWRSELPLECVDHSVRIRFFYKSIPSPWSDWKTNKGIQAKNRTEIFPFQRVLREGSSAMFCCVPPRGVYISSISISNKNDLPLTSVGAAVKAVTMETLSNPKTPITIRCWDSEGNNRAIWNYVSSPPQKPRNLSCLTSDKETVTCSWDSGVYPGQQDRNKQTQMLHIENSDLPPVKCELTSCTFPAVPRLEEYNISVVIKNLLGQERGSYSFNISDRVSPVVKWERVNPGVTDAYLSWFVQGNLTHLNLLCQVSTDPDSSTEVTCSSVSGFCNFIVEHLLPNTRYTTRVRCSADSRFWGSWTQSVIFKTYPFVAIDLWRRIKRLPEPNIRLVTLMWTPSVPGSAAAANIQGYTVQWTQDGKNRSQWVENGRTQVEVSIGPGRCDFTVQADIQSGSSVPAHMTIPQGEDAEKPPVEKQLNSRDAGFHLSWDKQDAATCGYTVDWCILGNAEPCNLTWVKLPEKNNSLFVAAGRFKAGCRNTFNIYGCRETGHRLLEKQTGYLQELCSVNIPSLVQPGQSTSSSVTLQWRYMEEDAAYPAFITGYLVKVQKAGAAAEFLNISDPKKKSVTVEGLQQSTQYIFSVSALTNEGPGPSASITIWTKANYSFHMAKILIVLLLLGCTVLLWPQIKMLQSELKEILFYPAGMNIRTPEFDSFLHETAERLQSQKQDECRSCEIEILNSKPPLTETPLRDLEVLNMPEIHSDYCPQLWGTAALQQSTCIINKLYFQTTEDDPSPATVLLSDLTPSCDHPEDPQQSCNVIYGYISKENL